MQKWLLETYELLDNAKWDLDEARSEYEAKLSANLCEKIEDVIASILDLQEKLCSEAGVSVNQVGRIVATKHVGPR